MSSTKEAEVTFHEIILSNNRKFCYSQTGATDSNVVLIFFHGLFGIGNAKGVLKNFYKQNNIHSIAPTLPGWGESDPIDPSEPIAVAFPKMIDELLVHLGKKVETLRLYIAGGSFGTVPAQILFGAPACIFSYAPCVQGLLLLAPFSSFHLHKNYKVGMSTANWISVGPLSYYLPFRLLPRLISYVFAAKLATPESAEEFLKSILFNKLTGHEADAFAHYKERYGLKDGEVEKNMGIDAAKSVKHSWEGFLMTATWLHADWGFDPATLTNHSDNARVYLSLSSRDASAHAEMAQWMQERYKNATIWRIDGGHLASLYHIQEFMEKFLKD